MRSADISAGEARRIALAAQGLDRPRPRGRVDVRHIRNVIRRLGLLQIDYVNVLIPAQYQVVFSRLGPYHRNRLDDLVYRRREFTEQWAHEASIVPAESWPLLQYRRESHRVRPWGFETFLKSNTAYIDAVLEAVRTRGPLTAAELPVPDGMTRLSRDGWSRSIQRCVLEAFFGRGIVAVTNRLPNFAREYDLAERVIPPEHFGVDVEPRKGRRALLLEAARAHGVGTAADLADYYRMSVKEARPLLADLVDTGDLHEVRVDGWREVAYLHPAATSPSRVDAKTLLSPFDPLIWFRARVARLFEFQYTVEIFIPQSKRRWGYYVLPFLLGDRLVARVDLKADRPNSTLRVLAAHIEEGEPPVAVAAALAAELRTMASWLELEQVTVGRRGGFARALSNAVKT